MADNQLVEQRFGRLTVIEFHGTSNSKRMWMCRCDCGELRVVPTGHLRSGNTTSCGCYARETIARRNRRHGEAPRGAKSVEYVIWEGMNQRCHNPNATNYPNYGGRGVTVCDRWRQSFAAFLADVGRRPSADLSLDRINPFGDYEPGNIRWATRSEQRLNQRSNTEVCS